jgi:hypothetical protein
MTGCLALVSMFLSSLKVDASQNDGETTDERYGYQEENALHDVC